MCLRIKNCQSLPGQHSLFSWKKTKSMHSSLQPASEELSLTSLFNFVSHRCNPLMLHPGQSLLINPEYILAILSWNLLLLLWTLRSNSRTTWGQCYLQSPLLTDFTPSPLPRAKMFFNWFAIVTFRTETSSLRTLKIMLRNFNKIVRSWIQLRPLFVLTKEVVWRDFNESLVKKGKMKWWRTGNRNLPLV